MITVTREILVSEALNEIWKIMVKTAYRTQVQDFNSQIRQLELLIVELREKGN